MRRMRMAGTRAAARRGRVALAAFALMIGCASALAFAPAPRAHAQIPTDAVVLTGPHPFLKENAITVHYLLAHGLGDTFSGNGLGLGYGYMLDGPLWLDLQVNVRGDSCPLTVSCGPHHGSDAEVLGGVAWRFRTDLPIIPTLRGGAGLVYLFPEAAESAVGLTLRGGAGAKYYAYDWLGFGAELGASLGHAFFSDAYPGSRRYRLIDLAFGIELQF